MYDMFELFRQAQGGAAFDNLARAYGMSPEQMRAAAAAVSPAFMQGFQRQAQDAQAASRFAELFQTEAYARAFEAQAAALDPSTRSAGKDALDALFGSKEVSRAVAAQASAASGVQAEIIRKVLPTLASILVGGFMKAAQSSAGAQAQTPGDFGPLAEFWRRMAGGGPAAAPAGGANPQNPFQEWFERFGGAGAASGAEPSNPQPSNPLGDMMAETLNTMFGHTPKAEAAPEPQPEPEPAPEPKPSENSALDDMLAAGREASAQNAKAMEQIFDAFFGRRAP